MLFQRSHRYKSEIRSFDWLNDFFKMPGGVANYTPFYIRSSKRHVKSDLPDYISFTTVRSFLWCLWFCCGYDFNGALKGHPNRITFVRK